MAVKHYIQATQQQPIPGREAEMHANAAGGFVFTLNDWDRLDRFLMLGSENGTYYAGPHKLSVENAQAAARCLQADPARVLGQVATFDHLNRMVKLSPALLVLAMASAHENVTVRKMALALAKTVCRSAPALFEFIEYVEGLRGWGRGLKTMVQEWYNDKPVDKLAYQVLKYQQRNGWSHRDMLRLSKPIPVDDQHKALYAYVTGKPVVSPLPDLVYAVENLKADNVSGDSKGALIRVNRLTWEMLPTELLAKPETWRALLPGMPLRAMVRNLGRMEANGTFDDPVAFQHVVETLNNYQAISGSRIHPLHLLQARTQYAYGQGERGKLSWRPSPVLVEALDEAFGLAVNTQDLIPGRVCVAIDSSGSMWGQTVTGNLSTVEVAAAMAMPLLRQSEGASLMVFDTQAKAYPDWRHAGEKLDVFTRSVLSGMGGGTDLTAPLRKADHEAQVYDAFVILTDNETWAGRLHSADILAQYREKYRTPTKLVVCSLTATAGSVGDPKDARTLNCVGVDPLLPQVVASFLGVTASGDAED